MDNGNRSNQESKFDFLATCKCLVKTGEGLPFGSFHKTFASGQKSSSSPVFNESHQGGASTEGEN